jgi:hypothetical protein
MEGEDGDFLSDILLHGEGAHVAGLDEMHIPDTQESTRSDEVQASRSTKGGKRSKIFHWEEDEVLSPMRTYSSVASAATPYVIIRIAAVIFWKQLNPSTPAPFLFCTK